MLRKVKKIMKGKHCSLIYANEITISTSMSISPFVFQFVFPVVQKLILIPADVSQNVTNKSCLACELSILGQPHSPRVHEARQR